MSADQRTALLEWLEIAFYGAAVIAIVRHLTRAI